VLDRNRRAPPNQKIEPAHMEAAARRLQFPAMQRDLVNHCGRTFSLSRLGNPALGVPYPQLA
jgi:hypothetical protein